MAKKSRRARKRARARSMPGSGQGSVPVAAQGRAPAEVTPARDRAQGVLDSHEYRYVTEDLRRVAILAGAMFALLIALSFFIR